MSWYLLMLKRWNDFSGRSRRKEYWMAALFNLIISVVIVIIDSVLGSQVGNGIGILYLLYVLVLLIPNLAITIRRLHDTGRSGWWMLIALIPLVGSIILIVWLATEGTHGDNQYGSDPKLAGEPA